MDLPDTYRRTFDKFVKDAADSTQISEAVRQACQRHLDDLERTDWQYEFDDKLADRACFFISNLQLSTGEWAGQQFVLEPFQVFVIRSIFGWVNKETRYRRFRQAYISMGRGNGKSPLAAAILLYCFCFDSPSEARAECYSVATKKDQARIVFDECERFVRLNQHLRAVIHRKHNRLIIDQTASTLYPLGSDSKFTDGLIPHCIVVDEMHALMEQHRGLMEKLRTAMAKRRQPLLVYITTAGNERSQIWRETYLLCKQVLDRGMGIDVESLFAYIAEIDDEDDPLDEACWPKANPMLVSGTVVKIETLRQEAQKVLLSPVDRVPFIRYYTNRYTVGFDKPITPEIWGKGSGDVPELENLECRAGFDWGWKDDLAALALVFPLDYVQISGKFKRRYALKVWAWCPVQGKRTLQREPWATWIMAGHLHATPGESTDTEAVYEKILALREQYWIKSIAIDPNNCRELGNKLVQQQGMDVCEFRQSTRSYHEPTQEFCQALAEGRILHGNNPLLAWAASNMILDRDHAGYCMPSKKYSEDKIDPMVACIMGLAECMFNADGDGSSFYIDNAVESF